MVDALDPSPRGELRFAPARAGPPHAWQVRGTEALVAGPGVRVGDWIRQAGRRPGGGTRSGRRALAAVEAPDGMRSVADREPQPGGTPACPADVVVDLTMAGIAPEVVGSAEVWRYRYGDDLGDDPAREALLDYVRHPGRTRVALVSATQGTILREGHLQWWRGEQIDRMLLDPGP